MVDASQTLIPLRLIPAEYRKLSGINTAPSESTVRRWYQKGVRGVRLEVCYRLNAVYTTRAAIKEFIHRRDADQKNRRKRSAVVSVPRVYNVDAALAKIKSMGIG